MRSVNFRDDVLHVVADKLGIDPEQSNFLTNGAVPIGKFIDQWVRRTYDARDWPEWTVTEQFTPVNHVVPYDYTGPISGSPLKKIGRVLKVFLVNPETTDAPVDTPFTILEDGIHCGYEHGTNVWIRYIGPPPRFTAVSWRPDFTYRVDDTVYSYTTGECYKSKVNNNLNHDPSGAAPRPLQTGITVERVPDDPGLIQVNKNVRIKISLVSPGPNPLNPPVLNDSFYIELFDADDTPLGDFMEVANGTNTLATILTNLRTGLLAALPGTFTITINTTDFTMDIQGPYDFSLGHTGYTRVTGTQSTFKTSVLQPYIPTVAASFGTPQENQLSLSIDQVVTGAVYTLTFTEADDTEHEVSYTALSSDSSPQILVGLINAIVAASATDTFFEGVDTSFNAAAPSITFATRNSASINAQMRPSGSSYWTLVPFPKALADQVIRGAYGDLLKEWGQTDKGAAEEQAVPAESEISAGNFAPMPSPPMTGQQAPISRYKL